MHHVLFVCYCEAVHVKECCCALEDHNSAAVVSVFVGEREREREREEGYH